MSRDFTEQELFWLGEFGDTYVDRNKGDVRLASRISLFAEIIKKVKRINSILEFGANIGLNLKALKLLRPEIELFGLEINQKAVEELENFAVVIKKSIFDFDCSIKKDFVLSKGLLIHLSPDLLSLAYDKLYYSSNKYICLVEYYNPVPLEIEYRGHKNKLFKMEYPILTREMCNMLNINKL